MSHTYWVGLITCSTPQPSGWLRPKQCSLSSILATGSVGQFYLLCSHGGPCHHMAVFIRVPREQPRLGMSAGFFLVGQYLQHWGDTDS
ncbi:hypothetical protein T05_3351 [Trichinella murrelli]|uniref:Uncharacterized protein n=1 Tax=Trichinella murrelli TaxID=144512 RepID=A0A0V0TU29_9BILA|nr:hypothetical protein T05_3351 [Trichinella murrelli]